MDLAISLLLGVAVAACGGAEDDAAGEPGAGSGTASTADGSPGTTNDSGSASVDGGGPVATGDAATGNDTPAGPEADAGAPVEPTACTTDADCTGVATGPCQAIACDSAQGLCVFGSLPDGIPCNDGDACTAGEVCTSGACGGGQAAAPACGGKECGTDPCGNSCGSCPAGVECNDQTGQCDAPPAQYDCSNVTYEGCCTASGTLVWCESDAIQTIDCTENPSCGWAVANNFFNCGVDGELPDPSGANPYLCPGEVCETSCDTMECGYACGELCGTCGEDSVCEDGACKNCSCDGLECGTNDCGEPCGDCADGDYCSDDNLCLACSCEGLACGTDECGTSCGTCPDGLTCTDGACIDDPCMGITFEGCCDGEVLNYCENASITELDCAGGPSCGWSAEGGYYDCGTDGSEDPTGANPKACPGGSCTPTCADLNPCGDDGCGGSCGECADGESCGEAGSCGPACTADCTGKECGDDGCGGICGECPAAAPFCSSANLCTLTCEPTCGEAACGDDGCGGSCGECPDGGECSAEGVCEAMISDGGSDAGMEADATTEDDTQIGPELDAEAPTADTTTSASDTTLEDTSPASEDVASGTDDATELTDGSAPPAEDGVVLPPTLDVSGADATPSGDIEAAPDDDAGPEADTGSG